LLADEPTGALDSASGDQVINLLRELNAAGQTLLVVTHDSRLADRLAPRMIEVADGRIARQVRRGQAAGDFAEAEVASFGGAR